MIDNGFMEEVPEDELNKDNVWYIMHHGVYHKTKKKIRIVFNCSLKYGHKSLNDALYQGIDMTNKLLGVLLRFRLEHVAFMGDITKMFYQVKVTPKHRDYLRFFWTDNGDLHSSPREYRLTVHVFGATSSPSVANYALRQTVNDNEEFSKCAKDAVLHNFYVDDLLYSAPR